MKIVIDIDNTLVDYRSSLYKFIKNLNINLGEIKQDHKMSIIKNKIKQTYGDIFWQVAQAYIYSDLTKDVSFYKNSNYFLKKAIQFNDIYLVSHKTKFGLHQAKNTDIRKISSERINRWLKKERLIGSIKDIIFTDTFDEKVSYIKEIDPEVIIDDLLEIHSRLKIIRSDSKKTIHILFQGNNYENKISNSNNIITANSWLEIINFF